MGVRCAKFFTWSRNRPRAIDLHRTYKEEEYEGYGYRYFWKVKGHVDDAFENLADRDWMYNRARHTKGWKNRRCRHQWEHHMIEREKHERNRMERAKRNGGALFPEE